MMKIRTTMKLFFGAILIILIVLGALVFFIISPLMNQMWTVYLKWLPVFGLLVAQILLFPGMVIGSYRALGQIYGDKHPSFLLAEHSTSSAPGRLPECLLTGGIGGIANWFLWFPFVVKENGSGLVTLTAILLGEIFGVLAAGLVKKWIVLKKFKHVEQYLADHPAIQSLLNVFNLKMIGAGLLGGVVLGMISGIVYGIAWSIPVGLAGWFAGAIVYFMVDGKSLSPEIHKTYEKKTLNTLLGFGLVCVILTTFVSIIVNAASGTDIRTMGAFTLGFGVLLWFFTPGIVFLASFLLRKTEYGIYMVLTPVLIEIRHSMVLCNSCFRYTHPMLSRHHKGIRYCEHCGNPVDDTREVGKLFVTFGQVPLTPSGRVFLLSDPDFEHHEYSIEIAEVYIDTRTYPPLLLERFLTYIINYPPEHGLESIHVFYQGDLDDLGENLKNALRNNFEYVEKIH